MKPSLVCIAVFVFAYINYAESHGRLMQPAARSSAWRVDPNKYPAYYNDMEMFCGGVQVQWAQNGGKCGICGENYAGKKLFEKGGEYYRGISIKEYKKGQVIDVHVELTANHKGWFEFRLCNIDGWESDATQECLDKTLLKDANGQTRFQVASEIFNLYYKIVLPVDVTCKQCVFQWKYNTGNSWGTDPVAGQSCLGCGPGQEQFYGCSDITITGDNAETTTTPSYASSTTPKPITQTTTTASTTITTGSTTTSFASSTTPKPITQTTTTASTTITTGSTTPSFASSTTPKPTTQTTQSGSLKCKYGDGYYPDLETGCKNYFVCSFSGTVNERITYFPCPTGLLFDFKGQLCNYPNLVSCVPY